MIALAVCGCDSYLDRQPDDQLTSKNIFDKKTTTLQYLVNVYTYIPSEWSPEGYGSTSCIAITASDEASCAYTGSRFFALLNHNQLSPLSNHGGYRHAVYRLLYQGISEATYFMSKVQDCPQLTDDEKVMWRGRGPFPQGVLLYRAAQMERPCHLARGQAVGLFRPGCVKGGQVPLEHDSRLAL